MYFLFCLGRYTSDTDSFWKLPIERIYVTLNLSKQEWLINCSGNSNKSIIVRHVGALSKSKDLHLSTYQNFIFSSDVNAGIQHVALTD